MSETQNKRRIRPDSGKNDGVILPASSPAVNLPNDYPQLFTLLKERIQSERLQAVLSANSALILMYWDMGKMIDEKQAAAGWGAKVIDCLSSDLKEAFPDMQGFSPRNLKYMRSFFQAWPDREIVQRTVAQIPWRSNLSILAKVKEPELRLWYVENTYKQGWSKNALDFQIETKLHARIGEAANNFDVTLPPADSDMANQIFKDPYVFDFLGTAEIRKEAELENKLVSHVEKFLLELEQGFAFVGRQVHMVAK